MNMQTIEKQVLALHPEQRLQLIDLLWTSLDKQYQKEIDLAWAKEAEARIDAFERGELEAIDGPTALKRLRKELSL